MPGMLPKRMLDETDPYVALSRWFEEANASEPSVPDAMQLATATPDGHPSLRTVLLKQFSPEVGLVFFTNYESRKAEELDANPHAAGCLHWKSLARQVIVEGRVCRTDPSVSDAYWETRPRGSQIGAWASAQSRPVASRHALLERFADEEARFAEGPVPRPPHWGGYALLPTRFEFWQGFLDRLHHRVAYFKDGAGWRSQIVSP